MAANLDEREEQSPVDPILPTGTPFSIEEDYLIPQPQLKRLFGDKSDMRVWRRLNDGTLPKPIKLNGRNHWKQS